MGGYQTLDAVRPVLQRGPVAMPVVDRALVMRAPPVAEVEEEIKRPFFVTTKMVDRMRKLRADGWSLHRIARELRVTHDTVRRHTIDIPPPEGGWSKGGGVAKFDKNKAIILRKSGLTYLAIAGLLGCSETCVHEMVNERRSSRRGTHPKITVFVQIIGRASGISCKDLRSPLNGMSKKGDADLSKARAILFWASWKIAGYKKNQIGRALGGFYGTTVADGIWRTEQAIAAFGLQMPEHPAHLIRALWRADWSSVPCAK